MFHVKDDVVAPCFGHFFAQFVSTVSGGVVDRLVIFEKLDAFVDAFWFVGGLGLLSTAADGKCDSCQDERKYYFFHFLAPTK